MIQNTEYLQKTMWTDINLNSYKNGCLGIVMGSHERVVLVKLQERWTWSKGHVVTSFHYDMSMALLNNVHKPSIPEGGGLEGTWTFTSRKLWMDIGPTVAHDEHNS